MDHPKLYLIRVIQQFEEDSIDEWSQAFKYQLICDVLDDEITTYAEVIRRLTEYNE